MKSLFLKLGSPYFFPLWLVTCSVTLGQKALDQIGATCDIVGTGFDLSKAQTLEEQYLLGHKNTKAILGLGEVPLQVAPSATKTVGMTIPISGFDLSPEISSAIKSGTIHATVEQQPYEQGFYAVVQLALKLKYGLMPSDVNTGSAIVDKSNVDLISALAGEIF